VTGGARSLTVDMTVRDPARLLADVQRLAGVGYWEWDVHADRIAWSEELFGLYGIASQGFAATYEAYLDLLHPEDRAVVDGVVQRACATGRDFGVEHRVVLPDGEVRWLLGRGTVERAGDEVIRLFGVAMDITERKRSESVLRSFVSNAAHELRTPIAAIASAVEMLGTPMSTRERGQVLHVLDRQVARMRELGEDLLDLDALDQRAGPVLLSPLALAPVVERALAAAAIDHATVDVAPDVVVMAGAKELELILEHLLTNAALHGGPSIEVRAVRDGDQICITVCDDGPGVPPAVREALFTPFARGVGAAGHGTGLGLAIVHRLVTMQRGAIEYRSTRDAGACFTVRLGAAG